MPGMRRESCSTRAPNEKKPAPYEESGAEFEVETVDLFGFGACSGGDGLELFSLLDAGSLALARAEVVQLGAANAALTHHFD
jgi:hypothetical protein